MSDTSSRDIERLRDDLDAVPVPAGFAAAQGDASGGPGQTGGFVWCAPLEDFADRYPHLPPDREEILEAGGSYVDVTIDLFNASGAWRVTGLSLEGSDLWEVLAGCGETEGAARALALLNAEVGVCASLLPGLLAATLRCGARADDSS